MNKAQVIIEYLVMNHNVNQAVIQIIITIMNCFMKIIQYKKEFAIQVKPVILLIKMVYITNIKDHINVYSTVHMVYMLYISIILIIVVPEISLVIKIILDQIIDINVLIPTNVKLLVNL